LRAANRKLEQQVYAARRDPMESERERNDYDEFGERLSRCIAFGQFAEEVAPQRQRLAQMGLLGTSAAFQVLSHSTIAAGLRTGAQSYSEAEERWLDSYLRCLNFLDMVVDRSGAEPDGELWRQRRLTLRICQMMRAMAAAAPVLGRINVDSMDAQQAHIVADLSQPLELVARHHIDLLSERLLACLISAREVQHAWTGGESAIEKTYSFAETSRDGPTSVDEWVFMWSTAIASAIRCWRHGLLADEERLRALCPAAEVALFTKVLREPTDELDDRFRLFGLWALSHLDGSHDGEHRGETPLPELLQLPTEAQTWLPTAVHETATDLMARPVSLVDSWQPYSTYMGLQPGGTLAGSNAEFTKDDLSDYREDVMVVPVVPVLMGLLSTYDRASLCRKTPMLIMRSSLETPSDGAPGRAKPYQLGNRDGVVNLSYWQESYVATARAAETMSAERFKRVLWLTRATIRDNGRLVTLASLVAATVIAYVAFAASEGVVSGVLFGVLASVLAAVVSPGLVKYLWGHTEL
jgi:hypothetical protein